MNDDPRQLLSEYRSLVALLRDEVGRLEERIKKLEEENEHLKAALELAKQERVTIPPINVPPPNVPPYLPGDPSAPWWTKPWMCNPCCGTGGSFKQNKEAGV